MWVRGDLGLSDLSSVQTWTDKTINGNSPTGAGGAASATFHAAGGPNNLPYLASTGTTKIQKGFTLGLNHEVFIVCKWDVAFSATALMVDGGTINTGRFSRDAASTIDIGVSLTATYASIQSWTLYHLIYAGAASFIYAAGVQVASGLASGATPSGCTLFIGGDLVSAPSTGSIAECIVYNGLQSTNVRAQTNAYLKSRYLLAGE